MNFRRVLGIAGGVFLAIGALDLVAGFGYTAYSARVVANTIVSLTFYTQNPRFMDPPRIWIEGGVTPELFDYFYFRAVPRWVERGVVAFDRDPGECTSEGNRLHVFAVDLQNTRYYAVAFFMKPAYRIRLKETPRLLHCTFVSGVHSYHYHPQAFAPFDEIIRRSRLEYAAHPELRNLPQATFPDHDKTMLPIPIPIPDPTATPNFK